LARRPECFPAFGQPVLAPADATVVRVAQRSRDHWSRNSWPALLFLLVESALRELTGPGRILGNHVVLRLDGSGRYVLLAHLRRGSVRVQAGARVRAGERIAECGNSGNSSEPHLHIQVMDHVQPIIAAGLPMEFEPFGAHGAGMPRNGEPFVSPHAPGHGEGNIP
jgi:murein DD-endopeptidase MepM/ murein hydrolase activator NlpD